MARSKKKGAPQNRTVHYTRKVPPRPLWMKIVRITGMIILGVLMLLMIIEAIMQYVHVIRKH
ncbi:MAG: hypothetical protein V4553_09275 [Bacteroidota bacterium]